MDKLLNSYAQKKSFGLGDTDYKVSFCVKDTLGIFGIEVDSNLDFSGHISNMCKKITCNSQRNLMMRFPNRKGRGHGEQEMFSVFCALHVCLGLFRRQ